MSFTIVRVSNKHHQNETHCCDVPHDVYFSMNRVIYPWKSTTSHTGIGLCKAVIRAVDCGPPQLTIAEQFNMIATVSADGLKVLQMNISNLNVGSVIKYLAGIITSASQIII